MRKLKWRPPYCAIPVAMALRHSSVEIASARQASEDKQTKTEMVHQYLTGPRFRHRVQASVEKFGDMQDDLERERRAMIKQWAKREEQIRGVLEATAGMCRDLQGIAGRCLLEVGGLGLSALEPGGGAGSRWLDHPRAGVIVSAGARAVTRSTISSKRAKRFCSA